MDLQRLHKDIQTCRILLMYSVSRGSKKIFVSPFHFGFDISTISNNKSTSDVVSTLIYCIAFAIQQFRVHPISARAFWFWKNAVLSATKKEYALLISPSIITTVFFVCRHTFTSSFTAVKQCCVRAHYNRNECIHFKRSVILRGTKDDGMRVFCRIKEIFS